MTDLWADPDYVRDELESRGPETCSEPGHVPGCAGRAGGDHEFVTVRVNYMRCSVCGHRLDSMGGCDSCAADIEALGYPEDVA